MRIPKDIQKEILEFFMRTSIPRNKAKKDKRDKKEKDNHLPSEEFLPESR